VATSPLSGAVNLKCSLSKWRNMRIIHTESIRHCVSFEDLIEPVAEAFEASSGGQAQNGLLVLYPEVSAELGDVYVKTATARGEPLYIVKISPWFKVNAETGAPQGGFIAAFCSRTGRTLALLDDQHYLSDIRTAAAGALAARVFVSEQHSTAAVLGAGVQAYWQVRALYHEKPFDKLLIWARNPSAAERLGCRLKQELERVLVVICSGAEEAVRQSDVLITATQAREPIVRGEWLHPGHHITAVGADDPSKCELDAAALTRARVFGDSIEAICANGDVHRWISASAYARDRLEGEIGEVLAGAKAGRENSDDITIAKFVGIGVQDLVAARVTLERLGAFDAAWERRETTA
jgi:ornithine cyclodeaminase/alanine dehydrogenase-like protein (mu-crystallin family)